MKKKLGAIQILAFVSKKPQLYSAQNSKFNQKTTGLSILGSVRNPGDFHPILVQQSDVSTFVAQLGALPTEVDAQGTGCGNGLIAKGILLVVFIYNLPAAQVNCLITFVQQDQELLLRVVTTWIYQSRNDANCR